MSASNSPERGIQGEDINASSEELNNFAGQTLDDTSLGEVEEPILDE